MEMINPLIQAYCDTYTTAESELLKQLNRETHAHVLQPRMLSGHFQGRLLSMISRMIQPDYVVEIGTYTGYSALCMAEGLKPGGKLITIDVNAEREDLVNRYIQQAGMQSQIQHIIGDAFQILKTLPDQIDLVFIDADKPSYMKYYELSLEKLRKGGFIIIDNVLWSGKVISADIHSDRDTQLLHQFNKHIQQDERVLHVLVPVRDGLMLVQKL